MDIKKLLKEIKDTTLTWLKSHTIMGIIVCALLIIGLSIINYKIVDFGNIIGIIFISLALAFVDFLPVFGLFVPMTIWGVIAMTFGKNTKLGLSIIILCFIIMIIKQLIEPFIVGKTMGISPIEEVFSSVIGFFILGSNAIGLILGPIVYTIGKTIYLKHNNKPVIMEPQKYSIPSKSKAQAKDITDDVTNIK